MAQKQLQAPHDWVPFLNDYFESLQAGGQSPHSVDTRRRQLTRFALDVQRSPLKVTADDAIHWLASHEWKAETRKTNKNALSRFFYWLAATGRRADDISKALPSVKPGKAVPHPCPDKVIIAAMRKATEGEQIMLRLGAECGLRREEMTRVYPSRDVVDDLIGSSLIVHGKGNKERIVPLPDDLAKILRTFPDWLYPGRWSGHVEPSYITKHLGRIMGGWNPHSLRHRYATTLWEETHDILLISKLLGHESVETTQRYIFMPEKELRRGMSALSLSA
ncbi:MAG: tyrosine-type recombinase/integrase [Bifidobacteriaceae bacterium]|jgi:site-specific recombinase XerD|nr:tyrosine-type recombinase/integrase [Bifidobacteriaceae bacterium]MCI1979647.1 tyrosine-type recombinase/integrase [Bifidobacteriaceae bacterium]